jgi:hypothetical protein
VQALIAKTGARYIFGLSAGALVVLRAARTTPALECIALYEPLFGIDGSARWGHGRFASILVRADDLAAVPGGELLVDAELGPGPDG